MHIDEIKKLIESYIKQALNNPGLDFETNKLDFKAKWYDLSNESDTYEFLKDTTAIVNSYGGSDGFIVIGFDAKSRKLNSTTFKDSKLRDKTDLSGIITKKVDRPFNIDEIPHTIDGADISILHIPPSLDKPHVITLYKSAKGQEYENEIFVRHASGAKRAKKYDLDLMYAEKRSLVVDKQVVASMSIHEHTGFSPGPENENVIKLDAKFTLENVGMKKVPIMQFVLPIMLKNEHGHDWKLLNFVSEYSLSKMKVLASDEIWTMDRLLTCNIGTMGIRRDETIRLLRDQKLDRKYVELRPLILTTISGDRFPCNMQVIEYKKPLQDGLT